MRAKSLSNVRLDTSAGFSWSCFIEWVSVYMIAGFSYSSYEEIFCLLCSFRPSYFNIISMRSVSIFFVLVGFFFKPK